MNVTETEEMRPGDENDVIDEEKTPEDFEAVFENETGFDPLAKDDPDITLEAKERRLGGLGIFLVKEKMDDMRYEYRDGKNILTLVKLNTLIKAERGFI